MNIGDIVYVEVVAVDRKKQQKMATIAVLPPKRVITNKKEGFVYVVPARIVEIEKHNKWTDVILSISDKYQVLRNQNDVYVNKPQKVAKREKKVAPLKNTRQQTLWG